MNAFTLSSFRHLAFLAFPLAAIFAACNSPADVVIGTDKQPIACNSDANCPSNQACVAGFCDPQSGTTGSGNGGNSGTGSATTGAGGSGQMACMSNQDCPVDLACINGVCENQLPGSTSTGGQMACTSNLDCPIDTACVNGVCEGQLPGSTSSGGGGCMGVPPQPEVCDGIDNDCDGVVDNAATCPNGGTCTGGVCVASSACMSDADCAAGQQICVAGACKNLTVCMSNADCPPPLTCMSGVCKP